MPAMVARDVAATVADERWVLMIMTDDEDVAGTVTVYEHDGVAEIGWMVLPPFQRRGLAAAAAREVVDRATLRQRWSELHAWPPVTNLPSNGVCRSLGFRHLGQETTTFGGRNFRTNHWVKAIAQP
jgi:RimJ/RimL family protein N-acetyltransferase